MITTITSPNLLLLGTQCHFYFNGVNVSVPMGKCSTKALESALDEFEAIDISVEFRVSRDEKVRAREIATYSKRMSVLSSRYHFAGFETKVIAGYPQATMTGRLTRCQ